MFFVQNERAAHFSMTFRFRQISDKQQFEWLKLVGHFVVVHHFWVYNLLNQNITRVPKGALVV